MYYYFDADMKNYYVTTIDETCEINYKFRKEIFTFPMFYKVKNIMITKSIEMKIDGNKMKRY